MWKVDPKKSVSLIATEPGKRKELTPREYNVLILAAAGLSNKQISEIFGISEQTVKNHMAHIMEKLNARNRTYAVTLGILDGRISLEKIRESITDVKEYLDARGSFYEI